MTRKNRRERARGAHAEQSTFVFEERSSEGGGARRGRLEHILLDEMQSLLRDEAADPALAGVRLLAVTLSLDGGHARVAYSVACATLGSGPVAQRRSAEGLARATGFIRARLAERLQLKKLPRLTFTFVGVDATGAGSPESGGAPCPE